MKDISKVLPHEVMKLTSGVKSITIKVTANTLYILIAVQKNTSY